MSYWQLTVSRTIRNRLNVDLLFMVAVGSAGWWSLSGGNKHKLSNICDFRVALTAAGLTLSSTSFVLFYTTTTSVPNTQKKTPYVHNLKFSQLDSRPAWKDFIQGIKNILTSPPKVNSLSVQLRAFTWAQRILTKPNCETWKSILHLLKIFDLLWPLFPPRPLKRVKQRPQRLPLNFCSHQRAWVMDARAQFPPRPVRLRQRSSPNRWATHLKKERWNSILEYLLLRLFKLDS